MNENAIEAPDISRAIQTGIATKHFSGAAATVFARGDMLHHAAYGHAHAPPPYQTLSVDAIFDLASLTKPLGTGLACLWLISHQRLQLNACVRQILKDFQLPHFETITVAMLLDHTSGLPACLPLLKNVHETLHDIRQRAAATNIVFTPGTRVIYSDINFIILGFIIECITNQSLDMFLYEKIYKPLGLQDDLFFIRHTDTKQQTKLKQRRIVATEMCPWRNTLLCGQVHDGIAWVMGGVAGHAGLFGTVYAVHRLCETMLACYHGTQHFFHGPTVQRFWTRSKHPANTTRTFAWDTPNAHNSAAGKRMARTAVGHLGFTGTSVWIDPATHFIGVLLTNIVYPNGMTDDKKQWIHKLRAHTYDLMQGLVIH